MGAAVPQTAADFAEHAQTRAERAVFEPYLDPGEHLLWGGRPMLRPLLEGHEIILPVVCLLLAASIFRVLGLDGSEATDLGSMRFFLVVMMAALAGTALWMPLRSILRRRSSHYAVTDKRAMILETGPWGKLRSYPLTWDRIVNVRLGRHVSVIFELERGAPYVAEIGFEQLDDGMAVYRLIREVQARDR